MNSPEPTSDGTENWYSVQQTHPQTVSVEIYDQIYNLRGTDAAHIEHIARVVDAKMRAVSSQGGTVDSLRVAVLAALNIADELLSARALNERLSGGQNLSANTMRERASSLSDMLDEVLEGKAG